MSAFTKRAIQEANFTEAQAEFLDKYLAKSPHDHTAAQIVDFDAAVIEALPEEEDDEEEEEDED